MALGNGGVTRNAFESDVRAVLDDFCPNSVDSRHGPRPLDRELAFFRFQGAVGGHASDGDQLFATLLFAGEGELVALFERLGKPLVLLGNDAPRPIVGKRYSAQAMMALASPIFAYPQFQSPGWITVSGVRCFADVRKNHVIVSLSGAGGDDYSVTEADFENAKKLEAELARAGIVPDAPAPSSPE